jgi:hypothetical protein
MLQRTRCSWYPIFSVEFFAFASCASNCAIQILYFGALRRRSFVGVAVVVCSGSSCAVGGSDDGGIFSVVVCIGSCWLL